MTYFSSFTFAQGLPASWEFFDYETEALSDNCQAALCIQISENLQKSNHFECNIGRLFNDEDYLFNGGTVPVILGYEYGNLYSLGTRFSATYLYDEYTFEVVGILEKDSRIYNPIKMIFLDKYIMMPSFHVLESPENIEGLRIHYANKTSGLIVSGKNGNWHGMVYHLFINSRIYFRHILAVAFRCSSFLMRLLFKIAYKFECI